MQTKRTRQGNDKEDSRNIGESKPLPECGSEPSTVDPTQRIKGTAMATEIKDDNKDDCEEKVPQHEPSTVISENPKREQR